jgi:hypothetical protein
VKPCTPGRRKPNLADVPESRRITINRLLKTSFANGTYGGIIPEFMAASNDFLPWAVGAPRLVRPFFIHLPAGGIAALPAGRGGNGQGWGHN